MNRWRKIWLLSWPERGLLLKAAFMLPPVAVFLRVAGLKRCMSALDRLMPAGGKSEPALRDVAGRQHLAKVTARLVRAAAAYGPYSANCLQQSLVLWWLLRQQGVESDLRIGTRKDGGRFEAHAWVELAGSPLNDERDVHSRYTAFDGALGPQNYR